MMLLWDACDFSGVIPTMVSTNNAFQTGSNDRDVAVKMFSEYYLDMRLVTGKGIALFRQPSH